MPYKDKTKQAAYQNKWMQKRRADWVSQNGPCSCGSTEKLTLVRKAQSARSSDSHIWSYSEGHRRIALRDYDVRCAKCAAQIGYDRLREMHTGKRGNFSTLNHEDVWAIRGRLLGKESLRKIARDFGIQHDAVALIRDGKAWSWLTPSRRKVAGIKTVRIVPVSSNKKTAVSNA